MQRSSRELWMAFIAILVITILYLAVVVWLEAVPRASGFFGHSLGILGFTLMLMTETLYSLRKRSRSARWGRMADWLNFHIFTGIVGPYLVLLHTSWKFNGLAGLVTLLTVIIVISGFVGRYIYTAVPRTVDGVEIEAGELEKQIATTELALQDWIQDHPQAARARAVGMGGPMVSLQRAGGGTSLPGQPRPSWQQRLLWWAAKQRMDPAARIQARQLEKLLKRQRLYQRQVASLAMRRRMLALWHAVHIPIGMVLFTAAFIHILAAIYYATLNR